MHHVILRKKIRGGAMGGAVWTVLRRVIVCRALLLTARVWDEALWGAYSVPLSIVIFAIHG